ncbi:MMPL family transporter [Microbispora sp. ZYX-F-249]|uniref:MMPL family transporter n=1 Tax=Microbispora maris TaxID=3144104 RepID=A0ABV0AXF2_9ACTN
MSGVSGAARLVCGRWTKWAVVIVWLAIVASAGPLAGKLSGIQQNDAAQWLPGDAEATQVIELQRRFQTAEVSPAVVVYERTSGITEADRAKAAADLGGLSRVDGVTGQVAGPIPAADGQALQVVVPLDMAGDGWDKIGTRVDAIRDVVGSGSGGLSVHVAGPAGVTADNNAAFASIDGRLLMATIVVVILILLFTYRSPVLWLLPVMAAGLALTAAQGVIYLVAENTGLTVNGQSAGILTVLVFGAGTDYALLLVARYREELRRHADRHQAMAVALRRAVPAIVASAATVAIGMLCLLFAQMNSTAGLGPVTAIGVVVALIVMITLLPALLVIFGRWIFWPVKPRLGSAEPSAAGLWARLGRAIGRRPRPVWIATVLVLGAMSLGLTWLDAGGLSAEDSFVNRPDSVAGQEALGRHYTAGVGQPVVVIGKAEAASALRTAVAGADGIAEVGEPVVKDGLVRLEGTLRDQPDSDAAQATVERVREAVRAVPGAEAKVGGQTALALDMSEAYSHDDRLVIPLVLLVVLVILGLLLRAVVAPILLMATVVLSFSAALGVSVLVFEHLLGFNGEGGGFTLLVFVFLVALGIDYNIFLMHRVREEARLRGTRQGALTGLAATGGVITSAGVVLAGTFAVLASLPLVFFVELGFAVALGVLLDTLVVRSVLVTALNLDFGRRIWWPSRLAAEDGAAAAGPEERSETPALVP